MRPKFHHHDCDQCGQQFSCDGQLERNHDGWPEVICVEFHERGQRTCRECAEREDEDAA